MTIFVDASALVAIIADEEDAEIYAQRIAADSQRLTSGMAIWETVIAVARRGRISIDQAAATVRGYVHESGFSVVPVDENVAVAALDAFARFGKGVAPAGLNMGDCFAYACAKANNARLLYKGDDFTQTDLAWRDDA